MRKRGLELMLDAMVAVAWAIYAAAYLARMRQTGSLINLGLVVYYTLVAIAFVRRVPKHAGPALWETALALVAVFLPILVLRSARGGLPVVGWTIQIVALVGIVVALVSLGRSFGIAPADRGLVTQGLYRYVRHPLYAAEFWFYIGYLISNPSWRNLFGLLASLALQVIRIWREERIIAGYDQYAQEVRWRLLPLVW